MLKDIAQDFVKREVVEIVLPLYRELVEKSKQEELCIAYDLFIDQKDPGHFIFIEEWPDRPALDAHSGTKHFTRPAPLIYDETDLRGKVFPLAGTGVADAPPSAGRPRNAP